MTTLLVQLPGRHANQVMAYLSSQYLKERYGFRETRYSSTLTFMGASLVDHSSLMTRTDVIRCGLARRHALTGHLLSDDKVKLLLRNDVAFAKGFFQRSEYFYDPFRAFLPGRSTRSTPAIPDPTGRAGVASLPQATPP